MSFSTNPQNQILLINKPYGWTSFSVVKKIRYLTKVKKVGHAGTLDPLATGLLIVCTGKNTKLIPQFMDWTKEYTGIITLGATTKSYDLETVPEDFKSIENLTDKGLYAAIENFKGEILQRPPAFSAIKKEGKRLYKAAREGNMIVAEPRKVFIHSFEIEKIDFPAIHFRVCCSKGTYIRSLAHDIGESLGVGGYLSKLERTKIGDFSLKDAWTMENFTAKFTENLSTEKQPSVQQFFPTQNVV